MVKQGLCMKKIITIVGARPQFIKAAIVSHAIREQSHLKEMILHTGQHYDSNMSHIFFEELDIPRIDFQLRSQGVTHAAQTGEMMMGIENILLQEKPDWLLIYGDTNSTLAGALAAAKLHIPIAHVEAGLRSYNRKMPEEINRLLSDQLSDILFTPTYVASRNLHKEGFHDNKIREVGDVMYDAALFYGEKAIKKISRTHKDYILATIHRAENTNDTKKLFNIFTALERLCSIMPVIMPLHPRTRKWMDSHFPEFLQKTSITLMEPMGFLDMIRLEKNARLIMTDSGGIQKEAFFYRIPCVTLREETEWVETVELKWNRLVSPNQSDDIFHAAVEAIDSQGIVNVYPYGTGTAAKQIANFL